MEKTYRCTINDRWMTSIENAFIRITTPMGSYVDINKRHLDCLTDAEAELVWKCYNEHKNGVVHLKRDQLLLLKSAAEKAGTVFLRTAR